MKEILEKYLAEQAKKDPAFAEKFDAKKMSACVSYVTSQARKYLQGKNGAVEASVIYKWARDFFNDGEAEGSEEDENGPKTKAPETPAEPKVKSWEQAKKELEAKKHKAKKKPKSEPESKGPKQLLFDFMQ